MSAGLSNGPGLFQGFGLEWIAGLSGGLGLTESYVLDAPSNITVPTISGPAIVGVPEVGTKGTWTNSPTSYAYQWKQDGVAISGANSINYTPVVGDVGHVLTLTVTATNSVGNASAASANSPTVHSTQAGQPIGILTTVTYG